MKRLWGWSYFEFAHFLENIKKWEGGEHLKISSLDLEEEKEENKPFSFK